MNKHTMSDLYSMQAAPLSVKIKMTARRIRDWVLKDRVCFMWIWLPLGKRAKQISNAERNTPEILQFTLHHKE